MITPIYAGILTFFYIALSIYVIAGRRRFKVALQDGQNAQMARRVRVHGNFAEYTPFFLFLLYLAESGGLTSFYVHLCGSFLSLDASATFIAF